MKIIKSEENGRTVLTVKGWLDTPSSTKLMQAIEDIEGVKNLVLDFDGVKYICSTGLRAVLHGYKKMIQLGGSFSVVRVRSEVMNVFRLAGFDKDLNIVAREEKE